MHQRVGGVQEDDRLLLHQGPAQAHGEDGGDQGESVGENHAQPFLPISLSQRWPRLGGPWLRVEEDDPLIAHPARKYVVCTPQPLGFE